MIRKLFLFLIILSFAFAAQNSISGSETYTAGNAPKTGEGNFDLNAPMSWLFKLSVNFSQDGTIVQKVIPNKPFNVIVNLTLNFWPTDNIISSSSTLFSSTGGSGPGLKNLTVNFITQSTDLPFTTTACKTDFGGGIGYYYFNKTGSCAFSISNGKDVNVKYYNDDTDWKLANGSAVMYCYGNISVNNNQQTIGESGNSFIKTFTINNPTPPASINANATYFCVLLVDMNDTYFSLREGVRYFRPNPNTQYSISLNNVQVPYCKVINVILSGGSIAYTGNPSQVTIHVENKGEQSIKIISVVPNDNGFSFSLANQITIGAGEEGDITGNLNYNGQQPMPSQLTLTFNVTIQSLEQNCNNYNITQQITMGISRPNLRSDVSCPFQGFDLNPRTTKECNASIIFENFQGKANLSLKISEKTQSQNTIKEDQYELSPDNNTVKFNITCEDDFKIIEVNASADPKNVIQESNENDNNISKTFYCMGSLQCSAQPVKVILLPGTIKQSNIFCGFDFGENRYLSCQSPPKYGVKDSEAGNDLRPELLSLIDIKNDTTTSQPQQAYMMFNASKSKNNFDLNVIEEDKSKNYIINITITGVRRQIDSSIKDLDYKCDINLTLLNSPCKYFV